MSASFFFYDLETTGFSSRSARIMQFAGQRTDMELNPIGEPVNCLIQLTPDILPEPDAILITGITPQQTLSEGYTEAEFLKLFYEDVVQSNTTFIGFNSVRFDDEFMRFLHYRNFYDAYEWQWKDGCSRWDLLDLVRMTRALRPDGIEWPFDSAGKPANRLEYLSKVNNLEHSHAHDALSDVIATIDMAKLIKTKQPELFEYLFEHRGKNAVKELVLKNEPFVYTSGRYGSEYLHTTIASLLMRHPDQDAAIVYDLRHDPTPFLAMSVDELVEAWKFTRDPGALRLPVKTLKYNRCPAVAPLGVIKDQKSQERIEISLDTISKHLAVLSQHKTQFADKIAQAVRRLDQARARDQIGLVEDPLTVDERLYDGFIGDADKNTMSALRAAEPADIFELGESFKDTRLKNLAPIYKARNYPKALSDEERQKWDEFCKLKLLAGGTESRAAKYFGRLQELAQDEKLAADKQYIVEELKLYGESILPVDGAD